MECKYADGDNDYGVCKFTIRELADSLEYGRINTKIKRIKKILTLLSDLTIISLHNEQKSIQDYTFEGIIEADFNKKFFNDVNKHHQRVGQKGYTPYVQVFNDVANRLIYERFDFEKRESTVADVVNIYFVMSTKFCDGGGYCSLKWVAKKLDIDQEIVSDCVNALIKNKMFTLELSPESKFESKPKKSMQYPSYEEWTKWCYTDVYCRERYLKKKGTV